MNPLFDIHQYPPTMTISRVLKFCEKKGLGITRGMIQNYIRDGILPHPVDKRQYTHNHLAALVLIDKLKKVFDIPTIKAVLAPHMVETGIPIDAYADLMVKLESLARQWQANVAASLLAESDGGALLGMAFAAELKGITDGLLEVR